jgi:hypothetical protein
MRRLIWIVVLIATAVAAVLVAGVALLTLSMLHMMDRTDAHACGLAAARRSTAAARLVGTPVEQHGFTGGSSSSENGELTEDVRFTVSGPRGTAYVEAQGRRSPLDSHLEVRIGRNGRSETIYSGPFDCPELHRTSR